MGLNLLVELDMVNEYYIDRESKKLYLHKDADVTSITISKPGSVITMEEGVKNVAIRNLTAMYSQDDIFNAPGVVNNVEISGTKMRHGGANAIDITGRDNAIIGNVFSGFSCKGVSFQGPDGDRNTLTSSGNVFVNNRVSDYGKWVRTYSAGLSFGGVSLFIAENEFFNSPHQGITGSGNDNIVANNNFHDLCFEASDSGAFYTGRSWSNLGNFVTDNVFTNIRTLEDTKLGVMTVSGVYLDDQMSGWVIEGNEFNNVQRGILVGGGRNNEVVSNTFSEVDEAISLDNRGLTWQTDWCKEGDMFDLDLQTFDYLEDPWLTAYPDLWGIFENKPCTPFHNTVADNAFFCVEGFSGADAYTNIYGDATVDGDNAVFNNTKVNC